MRKSQSDRSNSKSLRARRTSVGTRRLTLERLEERAVFAAGAFDTSFGTDGIVTTDFGYHSDEVKGTVIQSDGKIVAVGQTYVYESGNYRGRIAAARYLPNGALDPAFGSGGKVVISFEGAGVNPSGVALQGDGKIVIAGSVGQIPAGSSIDNFPHGHMDNDFGVVRLNSDGSLDPSFDGDGKTTLDFDGNYDVLEGLQIQPDGKIVVAGTTTHAGDYKSTDIAIARFNSDGSYDSSFNADGKATLDFNGGIDYFTALTSQPNGQIVVTGRTGTLTPGKSLHLSIARFNANGSLERTLEVDQEIKDAIGANADFSAISVALQSDGRLIVGGIVNFRGDDFIQDFGILRFNPDFTLDRTFDHDGIVTTSLSDGFEILGGVVVQPDGKIVAVGTGSDSNNLHTLRLQASRYLPNGALDSSFGQDGIQRQEFAEALYSVPNINRYTPILQSDGKIVISGSISNRVPPSENAFGLNGNFFVARLLGDVSLDASHDSSGALTIADTLTGGSLNNITVRRSGNNLVISDSSQVFRFAPQGGTLSRDRHTLTIPIASVTGKLKFDLGGGDDSLTIDSSAGDPIPGGGIEFIGGNGRDTLELVGNTANVWTIGAGGTGNLNIGTLGNVKFSGIELASGGEGNDTFRIRAANPITGLTLRGDEGFDTLDYATANSASAFYSLTNWNFEVGSTLINLVNTAGRGIEYAKLIGSGGSDTFDLTAWSGTGYIDGGAGNDRLTATKNVDMKLTNNDFTAGGKVVRIKSIETAGLVVAVPPASDKGGRFLDASRFTLGGVTLIGNSGPDILWGGTGPDVISGRAGNDILIGNGGYDQLFGEAGNDLLIGGAGRDLLDGGSGDNLLIAGKSSYDANVIAQQALIATWGNGNLSYSRRIGLLSTFGVGPERQYKLEKNVSVFDDDMSDTLIGRAQLDWFLADFPGKDFLGDLTTGETVSDLS